MFCSVFLNRFRQVLCSSELLCAHCAVCHITGEGFYSCTEHYWAHDILLVTYPKKMILTGHTGSVFAKENICLWNQNQDKDNPILLLFKKKKKMLYVLTSSWKWHLLANVSYRVTLQWRAIIKVTCCVSLGQSQTAPTDVWKQCTEWA